MDYPPIINLISATFDGLKNREQSNSVKVPTQAPQAVANAAGIGGGSETLGANSSATSGTNRVGTILDTVA